MTPDADLGTKMLKPSLIVSSLININTDSNIGYPYLSAKPAIMISSACAKFGLSKDQFLGVGCTDINMKERSRF